MTRRPLLCFVALLALVAAACGGSNDSASPGGTGGGGTGSTLPKPGSLDNRTFVVQTVTIDGEPYEIVSTIAFTFGEDDQFGASTGCNRVGGVYRIDGDRLRITQLVSTEMACEEPLMAQEKLVTDFLLAEPLFALDGDDLTLRTDDTVMVALDREVADPDRPFTGTTWDYDGIVTGDVASRGPLKATVVFSPDGTWRYEGCASASGTYTLSDDGTSVTLVAGARTEIACLDEAATAEEAQALDLMAGTYTVAIEAGTMNLSRPGAGLMFTAAS